MADNPLMVYFTHGHSQSLTVTFVTPPGKKVPKMGLSVVYGWFMRRSVKQCIYPQSGLIQSDFVGGWLAAECQLTHSGTVNTVGL